MQRQLISLKLLKVQVTQQYQLAVSNTLLIMSVQIHILTKSLHTVKQQLVISISIQSQCKKKTIVVPHQTRTFQTNKTIPANSYMGAGANDSPRSTAETVFIYGAL